MESSPSHPSKINITCMTLDSRALCAVCGAPAIGNKKLILVFQYFSYHIQDEILMHIPVYLVKVIT
jgi:hypothetical protein